MTRDLIWDLIERYCIWRRMQLDKEYTRLPQEGRAEVDRHLEAARAAIVAVLDEVLANRAPRPDAMPEIGRLPWSHTDFRVEEAPENESAEAQLERWRALLMLEPLRESLADGVEANGSSKHRKRGTPHES
jgi:hypothetical protein